MTNNQNLKSFINTISFYSIVGVLAAASMAIIEGVHLSFNLLLLSLALFAPIGLGIGLLTGTIIGGLRLQFNLAENESWWQRLRQYEELDRRLAGALFAILILLFLEVILVFLFHSQVAASMANPRLSALSTALISSGAIVLWILLFPPLWFVSTAIVKFLPRNITRLGGLVALGIILLIACSFFVLSTLDWRVLHFAPWIMLGLLGLIIVGAGLFFEKRALNLQRPLFLLVAMLMGIGWGICSPAFGQRPEIIDAALQNGWLLPLTINVGRSLGDRDHDGYSRWFAGGDCNDKNPDINPAAIDQAGNEIDEDCDGKLAQAEAKTSARPAMKSSSKNGFRGNLLLVCIDTLRADKLGVMGNKAGLTPTLDALAKEGVLFSETYSQGPNTPQSFPSFFTSQYTSRVPFLKQFTGYPQLKLEAETFFEELQKASIATYAISSHFYFTSKQGITQGVTAWDNRDATDIKGSNSDISATRIVPRVIEQLNKLATAKERFALFVHLAEPHSTYVTHPEFPITARGVEGLEQKYDFEIKFVDQWLNKILANLKTTGLDQNTAVIVFSDHGESFGEHKFYFHGQALYNEVLHVPLIIKMPGVSPQIIKQRTALLDLAPTILDLFGAPIPPQFKGISLLPFVSGKEQPPTDRLIGADLLAYPAWPKAQKAMFDGQYKLLWRITENRWEVYDLHDDPREQNNLAPTKPDLLNKLREQFQKFREKEM